MYIEILDLLNEIIGLKYGLKPKMECIQILTPTRYGESGSDYINSGVM